PEVCQEDLVVDGSIHHQVNGQSTRSQACQKRRRLAVAWGTAPTGRLSRRARPRGRVMFVLAQVSSMNIRRSGTRPACSTRWEARRSTMYGRFCSAAFRTFLEREFQPAAHVRTLGDRLRHPVAVYHPLGYTTTSSTRRCFAKLTPLLDAPHSGLTALETQREGARPFAAIMRRQIVATHPPSNKAPGQTSLLRS